jgi:hypothetical protein
VTDLIIPDSIEPVEAWRGWEFNGRHLESLHYAMHGPWLPGTAFQATCAGNGRMELQIVRGGLTLEEVRDRIAAQNRAYSRTFGPYGFNSPAVQLPPGVGYKLVPKTHHAPNEACICGIYAVNTREQIPAGTIIGKVKLWGTVIPGTKGLRAEFAYPSELHVPPELMDNESLQAYGVPILEKRKDIYSMPLVIRFSRSSRFFMVSLANILLLILEG